MARALDAADEVARERRGTGDEDSCRWLEIGSSEVWISGDCAGEGAVADRVGPENQGSCPDVSIDVLLTDYPRAWTQTARVQGASESSMTEPLNEAVGKSRKKKVHARNSSNPTDKTHLPCRLLQQAPARCAGYREEW